MLKPVHLLALAGIPPVALPNLAGARGYGWVPFGGAIVDNTATSLDLTDFQDGSAGYSEALKAAFGAVDDPEFVFVAHRIKVYMAAKGETGGGSTNMALVGTLLLKHEPQAGRIKRMDLIEAIGGYESHTAIDGNAAAAEQYGLQAPPDDGVVLPGGYWVIDMSVDLFTIEAPAIDLTGNTALLVSIYGAWVPKAELASIQATVTGCGSSKGEAAAVKAILEVQSSQGQSPTLLPFAGRRA